MEEVDEKIEYLTAPANMIISGATGSGKSTFVLNLLKQWPFELKRGNIIYYYSIWQELFEEFLSDFREIQFVQGLCLEKLDGWQKENDKTHIVITDDLMSSAVKNEDFSKLFTVLSHHKKILNIFLTQNLFLKGPLATTITRN